VRRRIFRWFTIVLFFACLAAIAMNVVADNSALLVTAEKVAREKAGCGESCRMTGMRGERGMHQQTMTYGMKGVGDVEVVCRRAFIVVGDYACEATVIPKK
jgi:cytochrome c-type biogenesis protein CcmE